MKKYIYAGYGLALVLGFWLSATEAGAQASKTASEKSYAEARRVLDAGIAALGGREALAKVEDVSLKFAGINYARNQSASPDTAYYEGRIEGELMLDTKGNRAVVEQTSRLPGFKFHFRQIIKADKGIALNMDDKTATTFTNPNALPNLARTRFPHAMLLTALERAATLRSLGQEDFEGRKQNVITFATSDGTQWTIYLDAATNLVTKFENLDTDTRVGDVTQEFIIPGYATVGGLKL
ncbi:MAG TPA: hypothetical protein VF766_14905, partial [Pyrinomonadaceae bacterium]